MAVQLKPRFISPEEYWEIEQAAETRSEYISGEMIAIASPSKAHGQIVANTSAQLVNLLQSSPCEANVGVSVEAPASFLIPDVVVYCNGGDFTGENDILKDPVVIFEVLSPSTAGLDRGHKWIRYQQIQSLMHYVLIAQDRPRIEIFTRDGESWRYIVHATLDDYIDLSHIDRKLPFAALYQRVNFDLA
jgi:Uma2 family endonuclease